MWEAFWGGGRAQTLPRSQEGLLIMNGRQLWFYWEPAMPPRCYPKTLLVMSRRSIRLPSLSVSSYIESNPLVPNLWIRVLGTCNPHCSPSDCFKLLLKRGGPLPVFQWKQKVFFSFVKAVWSCQEGHSRGCRLPRPFRKPYIPQVSMTTLPTLTIAITLLASPLPKPIGFSE